MVQKKINELEVLTTFKDSEGTMFLISCENKMLLNKETYSLQYIEKFESEKFFILLNMQ